MENLFFFLIMKRKKLGLVCIKEITMQPALCCLYNLGLDLNTTREVSVTINGRANAQLVLWIG